LLYLIRSGMSVRQPQILRPEEQTDHGGKGAKRRPSRASAGKKDAPLNGRTHG